MSRPAEKVAPLAAELYVWLDGGLVKASCQIPGLRWTSPMGVRVGDSSLALVDKVARVKNVLPANKTRIWKGLSDPLAPPAEGIVAQEFQECLERAATAGWELYTELSDNGLQAILEKINSMPDGSLLTVNTDCAFFPWEMLYPSAYSADVPADQRPALKKEEFWGYRFIISYNLLPTDSQGWEPPTDEHNSGPAFVSLNLNPTIDGDFKLNSFKPIAYHRDFFTQELSERGDLKATGGEITANLLSDENRATIIYLYCHGSSYVPFGTGEEMLTLDALTNIKPATLRLKDNKYLRAPVVILNSCSSAAQSPLSFSSFHGAFRKKGAMGVIGTTIQIPGTFAAAFGRRLIEDYLAGVPLGVALQRLRRELLDRGNPLGLFYSLQCPPDITSPNGGS